MVYYCRRLLPFFIIYVAYEVLEVGFLVLLGGNDTASVDNSLIVLGFLNETLISFIFCILPYLLYLSALPSEFHNGRKDRVVSLVLFSVFCLLNAIEELAEALSGDSFHLLTGGLLRNPREMVETLVSLPEFLPGMAIAGGLVVLSILFFRNNLTARMPVPCALQRFLCPFLLVSVAFVLGQAQDGLEIANASPELYSDGLYSFIGGLFAFESIPHLPRIYAAPCVWGAVGLFSFLMVNAAVSFYIGKRFAPLGLMKRVWRMACSRFGRFRLQMGCFLGGVLLMRLASLGLYPLMDTTEARYGEMARKMIETGIWLQPQFDYGVPFWGKPPLSFWASAATIQLFGANAFAARLAPFLASLTIGGLFYCWPFAKKRIERGIASCIIFFTCTIGFVAAGAVMTDVFLALGVTMVMTSFARTAIAPLAPPYPRFWGYLFFCGLAVGLLSKGPLILAICGLPVFAWTLLFRRWGVLWRRLPWGGGMALMLILTVPWYMAAECETPGFLRYFLIGEHVERFLVKGWQGDLYGSGHARSIGMIWVYALEMFLPWVLLVPFLLRWKFGCGKKTKENISEARVFLWLWGLAPLAFFTTARNILPAYVLPGIPAFCLLLSDTLWRRQEQVPGVNKFIFLPVPVLSLCGLFALGSGFSDIEYRCDQKMLRAWDGISPLWYANEKVTYSGQFYSKGKARVLPIDRSPDELAIGCFLATPESSPITETLAHDACWRLVSSGHKWKLFHKQTETRRPPSEAREGGAYKILPSGQKS